VKTHVFTTQFITFDLQAALGKYELHCTISQFTKLQQEMDLLHW